MKTIDEACPYPEVHSRENDPCQWCGSNVSICLPWRYDNTIHAVVDTQWDWMRHQGGDKTGVVIAWLPNESLAKAIVEAMNMHGDLVEFYRNHACHCAEPSECGSDAVATLRALGGGT